MTWGLWAQIFQDYQGLCEEKTEFCRIWESNGRFQSCISNKKYSILQLCWCKIKPNTASANRLYTREGCRMRLRCVYSRRAFFCLFAPRQDGGFLPGAPQLLCHGGSLRQIHRPGRARGAGLHQKPTEWVLLWFPSLNITRTSGAGTAAPLDRYGAAVAAQHVDCRFAEIQKLVLSGRMGEAIETTQQLYPNLLERNPDLLFMLK